MTGSGHKRAEENQIQFNQLEAMKGSKKIG